MKQHVNTITLQTVTLAGKPYRCITLLTVRQNEETLVSQSLMPASRPLGPVALAQFAADLTHWLGCQLDVSGGRVRIITASGHQADLDLALAPVESLVHALRQIGIAAAAELLPDIDLKSMAEADRILLEQAGPSPIFAAAQETPKDIIARIGIDHMDTFCRQIGARLAQGGAVDKASLEAATGHFLRLSAAEEALARGNAADWEANRAPLALYRNGDASIEYWLIALDADGPIGRLIDHRAPEPGPNAGRLPLHRFLDAGGWSLARDPRYRWPGNGRGWRNAAIGAASTMPAEPIQRMTPFQFWKTALFQHEDRLAPEVVAAHKRPYDDRAPIARLVSVEGSHEYLVSGIAGDAMIAISRTPAGKSFGPVDLAKLFEQVATCRIPIVYHDTRWRSDGRTIMELVRAENIRLLN